MISSSGMASVHTPEAAARLASGSPNDTPPSFALPVISQWSRDHPQQLRIQRTQKVMN